MGFRVPQFNLVCRLWTTTGGGFPVVATTFAGAPRLSGVMCSLTLPPVPPLSYEQYGPTAIVPLVGSVLLLPKLTDIRGWQNLGYNPDGCEVPSGSGRYYSVCSVEDRGKGFANEHRVAVIFPVPGSWTPPYS